MHDELLTPLPSNGCTISRSFASTEARCTDMAPRIDILLAMYLNVKNSVTEKRKSRTTGEIGNRQWLPGLRTLTEQRLWVFSTLHQPLDFSFVKSLLRGYYAVMD